jgi:hypothetical protein
MTHTHLNLFPTEKRASWPDLFDHAISVLHASWERDWCTLPVVLQQCIDFLSLTNDEQALATQQLLSAARELANAAELNCHDDSDYLEPKYHNRRHTAEVLVAITLLTEIESEISRNRQLDWMAAALLAALAHDFQHTGRVNTKPSEIEQGSMQATLPILVHHNVSQEWQECITHVVHRSDFALVAENHQQVQGQAFEWSRQWLTVLLNEADILSSSVSTFGEELGRALASEWQLIDFPAHEVVATAKGRDAFLKSLHFSSNASRELQVQDRIQSQLL